MVGIHTLGHCSLADLRVEGSTPRAFQTFSASQLSHYSVGRRISSFHFSLYCLPLRQTSPRLGIFPALAKSPGHLVNSRVLDRIPPNSRTAQGAPCFSHLLLRAIPFVTALVLLLDTYPPRVVCLQNRHASITALVVYSKKSGAGTGPVPVVCNYSRLT